MFLVVSAKIWNILETTSLLSCIIGMAVFSVCTAFFNDSVSDAEALWESIKIQGVDFEWVVTDDFSEDASARVWLLELAGRDSRVRYVEQERKMQFMRNPAPFALGEYVFHIDSDDLVFPGYLSQCERAFSRFPEVGVVLANSVFVDQRGNFTRYQQHGLNGMCFLGRCWRRSLGPDLSSVLGDGFFTLCNDMFIVRALEASCSTLILPRVFIRYREHIAEETGRYEPFGSRMSLGERHLELHEQSLSMFMEWYEPRRIRGEGIFRLYDPIEPLTRALWPFAEMPFFERVFMQGFSHVPEWHRLLLEELYPERSFQWGGDPDGCLRVCSPGSDMGGTGPLLACFPPGSDEEFAQAFSQIGPHLFVEHSGWIWLMRL